MDDKTNATKNAVRDMADCGYTYREIQKELGLSSTSLVSYYLKGHKIHIHRLRWNGERMLWSCKCGTNFREVKS
jgi:DNA invertase Pin-like site-specific DNA recombinase